ncbi:hypothetical protein CcaverHIS002_0103100 [Cutaneotrichosporon cavernicola]|uniref:MFS general substrate transporter n=1 Tax=Cutaneotrichosporon cavernicola TaxID=279322 RepID=A0AA48IB51_9TREE|nr:uncharacterized protein CcaverHIS019_0103040 [Cutaneotrichosporon cavernicola]BEI79781.1 hypothetical protein CcaverHIS002_0103100 [Cutaneotrichosporon cavernicola]BEI87586.1 hypothetical protein CcaverHIS019_0103040 [Cutaneotrichosporon cavernicola]BEI95357.1 hypothetical protein CcaverHIS631_0103060 [Cutaneotrichosporon cavernicola]BEJ03131.1 hypothetical protein CcaverHIS641_0103060 [Cutaneotrichosporon cavernicola]
MLSGGMRGRNVEDVGDLEEKGLLRSEKGTLHKVEEEKYEPGLKSRRDRHAFALLVVLYLLQGVPLGLTFGTLPFLLKHRLSYSKLAIFALSTWPYSLKLLWSPIVDAWFYPKWGRRKSWIVPVQAIVGIVLYLLGRHVEDWISAEVIDINFITFMFASLIFAAATQDIAVDGWALTLLSPPNLSYASTAQTIGLGIGSALSFTIFLAFNSVDFSNRYFRSTPLETPLVSLGAYMRFWGGVYIVVTAWLIYFKKEDDVNHDEPDLDVAKVYRIMWSIVGLKNIQSFLFILLIAKFGFQVNESVTQLKLLEKGLSKEDLAVAALLDFPAQMVVGWLAAKWSRPPVTDEGRHPLSAGNVRVAAATSVLKVWIGAFWARLGMAVVAAFVVWLFPSSGKVGMGYFSLVILTILMTSLTNTVQFVGITAFHTQIADPLIGGTYMTLLNTVSNLGGTWPKPLILRAVDLLTRSACSQTGRECTSEEGKAACTAAGGRCVITRDGYFVMTALCVVCSGLLLVTHILPSIKRLMALPMSAWRVKIPA